MSVEQAPVSNRYQEVVTRLYHSNKYDFVGVALRENQSPHLTRWIHVLGNTNERWRRIVLRRGIGLAGLVVQTGHPFLNNEILQLDYRDQFYCPIARLEQLTNVVAVPIKKAPFNKVVGVLLAGYREHKKEMNDQDIQKLSQYLH